MLKIKNLLLIIALAVSGLNAYALHIKAEEAFSKGVELYNDDQMPQAMQCFKLWLKSNPGDAYSWAYVAAIEMEAKHYYAALDASDNSLKGTWVNDRDTTFKSWNYYNRSIIHANIGDTVAAIEDISRAIDLNHSDPDYYYRRATLYNKQKEYYLAAADFEQAIRMSEADAEPYIALGCVYSAQGRRDDAIEAFTRAIEVEPRNSNAYSYRAAEHFNNKNMGAAVSDDIQALQLDRNSVHALWVLEYLKADAKGTLEPALRQKARETGDNTWLDLLK